MSNPTAQGKEQGNTMEKHILVALPLSEAQRDIIRQAAPQFAYRFTTEETATREEILWADAILGNVPVALIRQNKHLEWFQSNFAGPDPYLEPGVLPENCLVTNATGAYGLAISEWMLGMWLALAKDLQLYRTGSGSITGRQSGARCVPSSGRGCSAWAWGISAPVLPGGPICWEPRWWGWRRHGGDCPDSCLRVVDIAHLDEELPQADLVAMSLPGTPETYRMFDAARLARCKRGAILLNVGRGSTVDCDALARAVQSGALYGAALDVTDPEPLPPDHPLWSLDTVLITPHISGRFSLPATLEKIVAIFAHNLQRYAAGQTLDNQMSRSTHYVSEDTPGRRLTCE